MSNGAQQDRPEEKPIRLIGGEIKSLPLSRTARKEVGQLLRLLQDGESIGLPHSRPMPSIGPRCHELRVRDADASWRVFYRIDDDAIVVIHACVKTTRATPKRVIDLCKKRLKDFDAR
jgi:phage-related protein